MADTDVTAKNTPAFMPTWARGLVWVAERLGVPFALAFYLLTAIGPKLEKVAELQAKTVTILETKLGK